MGRNKKDVVVDAEKVGAISTSEKLQLINDYNQLFYYELSKIPYVELTVSDKGKAESVAEEYYRSRDFQVYRSRVRNGYRSIGVEFYWKEYQSKISESDRKLIRSLRNILSHEEFEELAMMVQTRNGTPDLLLIKDQKISFVEVKFNYETVKPSTVQFYLKHGGKWPISIIRIIMKNNIDRPNKGMEPQRYFSSTGREILSEARAARAKLIDCLDLYFSFHHHDDSRKPASARNYLRRHLSSLVRGDAVITFNWDTLAERTLAEDKRWCPVDGYGFFRDIVQELPDGNLLSVSAAGPSDVVILKLHGSCGWRYLQDQFFLDEHGYLAAFTFPLLNSSGPLRDAAEPRSYLSSDLFLVYPSFLKNLARPVLTEVWSLASAYLCRASFVKVIGYSLPPSDSAARALLLPVVHRLQAREVRIVIQDKSPHTLERWRAFLGPKAEFHQEEL